MRIALISDIHGNFDALSALPRDYDELWVLGDLVNYGPQPKEVVDFIRAHATVVIRGNHDQYVGNGENPRCLAAFREMAQETRAFSAAALSANDKLYLRSLPTTRLVIRSHTRFFLCHATPSDPLYEYREADSDQWLGECQQIQSDIVAVGHTHIPFLRSFNHQVLVNPGSIGQSRRGSPDASYALWEDGRLSLRSYPYPLETTMERIRSMPIAQGVQDSLMRALALGELP